MRTSFDNFWSSDHTENVEDLYGGLGITKKNVHVNDADVQRVYRELHDYANSPDNFAPAVHAAINVMSAEFERLAKETVWGQVDFISDRPGKNENRLSLGGGGITTTALARLIESARARVVIQSPYLVLTDQAMELFRQARARGVRIRINTNSLASTDNLPAFGGYRSQREKLLNMGLEIYEYRPDAQSHRQVREREILGQTLHGNATILGLHAKTLVVDGKVAFIGTFNLDPRSQNLNTEVGAVIHNEHVASAVEAAIETDMLPGNSWNAATDEPDQYVPLLKRARARFWRVMPIKPLL